MPEAGANAFEITNLNPLPEFAPQQPGRTRRSSKTSPDFEIVEEDPIYHLEGLTDNYYKTAGALEGFAKMAYDKFGVDVTTPSFGNPQAMVLHKIFLKGLASTQAAGNKLKNAQAMYAKAANNPNYMVSIGEGEIFNPQRHASNLSLSPIIKERNTLANKDFTPEEAEVFNQQQEQLRVSFLQKADEEAKKGNTANAQYFRSNADAIQLAIPSEEEVGRVAKQQSDIALTEEQVKTQKSMQTENYAQARAADALAEQRLKELEESGGINKAEGRYEFLSNTVGVSGKPNEANLRAFFGGNVKDIKLVWEDLPEGFLPGESKAKVREIQLEVTEDVRKLIPPPDALKDIEFPKAVRVDKANRIVIDISTPEMREGAIYQLNELLNDIYETNIPPEQLSKFINQKKQYPLDNLGMPQQEIDLGFGKFDNL